MSDLKPCPFCGNEYSLMSGEMCEGSYMLQPGFVFCCECGAEISERKTEAEAIEAWNHRVATDTNVGSKVAKVLNQARISRYSFGECGACGAPVIKPDKFCSECGAKLEWSDDE